MVTVFDEGKRQLAVRNFVSAACTLMNESAPCNCGNRAWTTIGDSVKPLNRITSALPMACAGCSSKAMLHIPDDILKSPSLDPIEIVPLETLYEYIVQYKSATATTSTTKANTDPVPESWWWCDGVNSPVKMFYKPGTVSSTGDMPITTTTSTTFVTPEAKMDAGGVEKDIRACDACGAANSPPIMVRNNPNGRACEECLKKLRLCGCSWPKFVAKMRGGINLPTTPLPESERIFRAAMRSIEEMKRASNIIRSARSAIAHRHEPWPFCDTHQAQMSVKAVRIVSDSECIAEVECEREGCVEGTDIRLPLQKEYGRMWPVGSIVQNPEFRLRVDP